MSPGTDLFPAIEPLLGRVSRPVRYVGAEPNSVVKPWDEVEVRWCLMYPDVYEIGQPNQGLAILYELLNQSGWMLAERTFSVWPDMERAMRDAGVPQFSLESHSPVRAFDILGVSLGTELGHTNFLNALDLAGIPLRSADRGADDPIVVAGGHAAFNPEPLADFLDAVVLGDGEQAALAISEAVREWAGAARPGGRIELLERLARDSLAYVPGFYDVDYAPDGQIERVRPNRRGVPTQATKHVLTDLDAWPLPARPIVPIAETVHDRYSVEIFRGCTRGCRFCQAGMVTRPVRERDLAGVVEMAAEGVAATGCEEVGLLSLSSSDHSQIESIARELADRFADSHVSLSLPSTRVGAFNVALADELVRGGRRSGLTFAPEGGSERLRRVINKTVTEDDLIATAATAFARGWRSVKLYFMCGLPTETDEDVVKIADLAERVVETGREARGSKDVTCTISIGGFVPKSHTPFQWAAQAPPEVIDARLAVLRDAVRAKRRVSRAITLRCQDGRPGQIEGLLARGDRRVAAVIERVWREGGRFDGWQEHFSHERWRAAAEAELAGHGLSLDWYTTRERDYLETLPWDHIDVGLDRDWLWDDWLDARAGRVVTDCRWTPCSDCGVCPKLGVLPELAEDA